MSDIELFHAGRYTFKVRRSHARWDQGIIKEVIYGNPYSTLLEELRPGDVCLDIGAHIGAFTIQAASRGAHVFAFEPIPENYALLVENIALNGFSDRVTACPEAVWSYTGDVAIWMNPENTAGGGVLRNKDSSTHVGSVSLADVIRREQLDHCRGLKLDAETSEYEILGALSDEDLQRFDVITIEYHVSPGRSVNDLITPLRRAGFVVRWFAPEKEGDNVGMLHAMHKHYLQETVSQRLHGRALNIQVEFAPSRYTQLPLIGRLWSGIRSPLHELVVYYLQKIIRQQNRFNEDILWILASL